MVVALVLASCGPAEEEEEEVVPPPVEEEEEEVTPPEEEEEPPMPTGPKYGGQYRGVLAQKPLLFDEALGYNSYAPTQHLTNEELVIGDWIKGPTGTGESSWMYYAMFPAPKVQKGGLAESWEVADDVTLIFKIREGVHWHDKPPVNGRELVAEDVAFTHTRLWASPRSYQTTTYPYLESATATDKYTVVYKSVPGRLGEVWEMAASHSLIIPPEVVEQYGDMNDWKNACGTGAFMLVDYVDGSTATFVRNPNYWQKDPFRPENTLPYLDGVKLLVITDVSTQMAALRTGKIDRLSAISWEDGESLIETNPELEYVKYFLAGQMMLCWRLDKPELPFYDLRVRQALCMAVDNQAIADDYYGGNAELITWPIAPILVEWADLFIPLNELPDSVREQFEYHPDKAKQLLAEAGYPDGFKTEVVCYQPQVDLLSIVKAYWADIGVDLELNVKEYGAYSGMVVGKTFTEMAVQGLTVGTLPFKMVYSGPGKVWNVSMVNDPRINETYAALSEAYFDEPKRRQMMKELVPYMLEQCHKFQFPTPYVYTFWQPWIKNYSGEMYVGYTNLFSYTDYIWLDQDLREEMTGVR